MEGGSTEIRALRSDKVLYPPLLRCSGYSYLSCLGGLMVMACEKFDSVLGILANVLKKMLSSLNLKKRGL